MDFERGAPAREPLWAVTLLHVLLIPVYVVYTLWGAASEFLWAGALIMGGTWLVGGYLFIRWHREGRTGILPREVAWAVLSWLNIALALIAWIPFTRPLLVPRPLGPRTPPEPMHGAPGPAPA
jgi:hypothetical protein